MGDVFGPATNNTDFVPQWDGANSKTLKNGLAVGVGTSTSLLDRASGDSRYLASPAFSGTPTAPEIVVGSQHSTFPFPNVLGATTVIGWSVPGRWAVGGFATDAGAGNPPGGQSNGGILGLCQVVNTTSPQTGYAGYFEVRMASGLSSTVAIAHGVEICAVNFNTGSLPNVNPQTLPSVNGLTETFRLASGRTDTGSTVNGIALAMSVVNTGAAFDRGIVFDDASITSNYFEALTLDGSHKIAWYSAGSQVAFDRADTVRRYQRSQTLPCYFDLVRAKVSGGISAGDVIGTIRALFNNGPDNLAGQLFWMKDANSSYRSVLTAIDGTGSEFGLIISEGGNVSVDPLADNSTALGGVHQWSSIRSQTALTVVSDERLKYFNGPIPQKLLDSLRDVSIQVFQFHESIAQKGSEWARRHIGVSAQEIQLAFENAGEDAGKWGVFCEDPVFVDVEIKEEFEVQKTETVEEETFVYEAVPGGIRRISRLTPRVRELWLDLLLFDENGEPIWAIPPKIAEDGTVLDEGLQAVHRVPDTIKEDRIRLERRQDVNDDGSPKTIKGIRYEQLLLILFEYLNRSGR